jgi:tetratricopeptide (TPR) repeat protein
MAHMTNQQAAAGVIDAERAVELAPNLALVQCALGWARIYAGRFEEAIGPIETAMRISPRDPISYFFNSRLGLAHYHLGNFEEAASYSQRSLFSRPRYFNMLILLASLGRLGRDEDARALLPQVHANRPPDPDLFWKLIFPYANPADRAAIEDGLSLAGL